jgi:hypothetical protein
MLKNKIMMTINNKHMNIWANDFKGYCASSYVLVNDFAGFNSRPNSTEAGYVVQDIGEW